MRYFQKAVRRAKLDISYSKGFSPHQLISFAAPMPLGMTSLGEYCDADFESVTDTEDMMRRFNCVSTPDLVITDIVLLPDGAKNSMSVVAASDYLIELSEEGKKCPENFKLFEEALKLSEDENLMILKKTKKSETYTDIKPLIYEMEHRVYNHDYTEYTVPFSNKENTEEYLRNRINHLTTKIDELIQVAEEEFRKDSQYENEINRLKDNINQLKEENENIKSSNSWKITKPLRNITNKFK